MEEFHVTQSGSFEVVVRRKVPYVTNGLLGLLGGFLFMLLITEILFIPTRSATLEMQTAYFILVVPAIIQKLSLLGVLGVLVTGILQAVIRRRRKAILEFHSELILVSDGKWKISIPIAEVKRVYVIDPRSMGGVPKGSLSLEILDRWNRSVYMRLTDYSHIEELLHELELYQGLEIKICDMNLSDDFEDERAEDQWK